SYLYNGLHRIQLSFPCYDVLLAFAAIYFTYHKFFFYDKILQSRITGYVTLEVFISILGILFVLEATRRTVGIPIVIVASVAILYAIFGKFIPKLDLCNQYFIIMNLDPYLW